MEHSRQLSKEDMLFVAGESDTVYQHTGGLMILDTSDCPDFDYEHFRAHTIERFEQVPHFHWKLHQVPFELDLPYWVEDEDFSYDHHFKRIAVPSPGDSAALGELVSHLYGKHMDRSRPLWEMWFIEGLEGGGCAILQKMHHCMMDGQGATKLMEILCDFEPEARPRVVDKSISGARAGKVPDQRELSRTTALHLMKIPYNTYRGLYDYFRPRLLDQLKHWNRPAEEKDVLPQLPFNAEISADRGFVFGTLPLADIKRVGKARDVTVNDVLLALVSSSLRRYLQARDELPDASLRASIPVSLRTEGDDQFGNKVTNASVTLATDQSAPLARLKAISAESSLVKKEIHKGGTGLLEIMQLMPPLMVHAMIASAPAEQAAQMIDANLVVSNVRASPIPMYIAGARLQSIYPMSILTPGMGINFTCVGYADGVDFGIAVEPELVPEPWKLINGLHEAMAEYLAPLKRKKPKPRKKQK